jgi:hypothetical protein
MVLRVTKSKGGVQPIKCAQSGIITLLRLWNQRRAHYRPKERPHMVRIVDEKTKQEGWIPLIDDDGASLYPELMAELDAIKRQRIGGLMLCRDWGDRGPWPTST